jgi:hypothetical protein
MAGGLTGLQKVVDAEGITTDRSKSDLGPANHELDGQHPDFDVAPKHGFQELGAGVQVSVLVCEQADLRRRMVTRSHGPGERL